MRAEHKKKTHTILFYAPRIFTLLVGLFFLSLAGQLRPGYKFLELILGLLPGIIVVLAIILLWNKPRRASLVFAIITLAYTIIGFAVIGSPVIGAVTLPLLIISALLIINVKSHMFL